MPAARESRPTSERLAGRPREQVCWASSAYSASSLTQAFHPSPPGRSVTQSRAGCCALTFAGPCRARPEDRPRHRRCAYPEFLDELRRFLVPPSRCGNSAREAARAVEPVGGAPHPIAASCASPSSRSSVLPPPSEPRSRLRESRRCACKPSHYFRRLPRADMT
jgi:hypothetical protein